MTDNIQQAMLAASESLCPELAQLLSKPALIAEQEVGRVMSIASGKLRLTLSAQDQQCFFISQWALDNIEGYVPYRIEGNGIAVIPVMGVMLNRFPYMYRYATGYEVLTRVIKHAVENPRVKKIVLDVDSPGGMASGCFETARFIREASNKKTIYAHVNHMAASAAYALTSAASEIHAIPSATIGSIGVVLTHWSYEKLLDSEGIKVTHIYAGEHKVDGTPYKDLPKEVQDKFQREVVDTYNEFTAIVSSHRSIELQSVVDTQADTFNAKKAIELGLIDGELAAHELPEFLTNLSKSNTGVFYMSAEEKKPEASASVTQEQLNKEKAESAKAATTRIQSILASDEAKKRQNLANHLAFNTTMSAEDAIATLKISAEEHSATQAKKEEDEDATSKSFNTAMKKAGNPNLTSEEVEDTTTDKELSPAGRVKAMLGKNKKTA